MSSRGTYKLLVITPSRGRPDHLEAKIHETLSSATKDTQIAVGLDTDEPRMDEYLDLARTDGVFMEIGLRKSLSGWTNHIASKFMDRGYSHFASLGDDHRPRTVGWDALLMRSVSKTCGPGFAYGDDLAMGPNLPTAVVVSTEIVRALGWFCLPCCQHYCVDNAWKDLGNGAGCLVYNPDVIIEHLHCSTGKSQVDQTYLDAGGFHTGHPDYLAYLDWQQNQAANDIAAIRRLRA